MQSDSMFYILNKYPNIAFAIAVHLGLIFIFVVLEWSFAFCCSAVSKNAAFLSKLFVMLCLYFDSIYIISELNQQWVHERAQELPETFGFLV